MTERNEIRVVVLTGGPEIAGQVIDFMDRLELEPRIELAAVYSESPGRGLAGVLRDLWKRRGLLAPLLALQVFWRAAWRRVTSPRAAKRRAEVRERLRTRTHYVKSLHADSTLSAVRALEPDLGLVYGGPIVKPDLFEIPKRGCLGIHHGSLPEYRGKKTTFWAIYHGKSEVGVAIQRIGSSLDRGDVLMQAVVRVRNRPLPLVAGELEKIGIELYVRAVLAIRDGTASFTTQLGSGGTLYKDPGVLDIVRFWYRYCRRLVG